MSAGIDHTFSEIRCFSSLKGFSPEIKDSIDDLIGHRGTCSCALKIKYIMPLSEVNELTLH